MRPPTDAFAIAARNHACEELKKVIRAAFVKRAPDSGPRGAVILAAVEALPTDWTKFDQLTDDEQRPLKQFLVQAEINFAADDVQRLIEENFPELVVPLA